MNEIATTHITAIEWNIGRQGLLQPSVIFDPVQFGDYTSSKISLHKCSDIRKLKLGIGDEIVIYYTKNGISKIVENKTESDSYGTITRCPFCNTLVKHSGDDIYCNYPWCKESRAKVLLHFCRAMNIKGMDIESIRKLVKSDGKGTTCRTPLQLLTTDVKKFRYFLGKADGEAVYQSIQDAKYTTLAKFIWALDITVEEYAKRLADDCNEDIDLFLVRCLNDYDWSHIPDFAEFKSKQINSTVKLHYNEIKELRKHLIFCIDDKPEEVDFVNNKEFVVTGDLHIFKNRNAILNYIDLHGGRVRGIITKKTSFLINNDTRKSHPKNKDAALFGVPVITEDEFVARCKGKM